MRILIDEGYTTSGKLTGIGHQAVNLYAHLSKITDCDITTYSWLRYIPKVIRKFIYIAFTNIHSLYNSYDIIHYQNFNTPKITGKNKKVVTIHDLGMYRYPETVPFIYVKYNQKMVKDSVERADLVITPSNFIKEEIISLFPNTDSSKITPCQDGIREIFWDHKPSTKFIEATGLKPFSYFFFVGSLTKRKNLKFLLESFIEAKHEGRIDDETLLVLAGSKWWGSGEIKNLLKNEKNIITLGYVSDENIVDLYSHCKAFVFPSLYEGFGMPVIEAMSQNIPIIISDIPTNKELNEKHNNQMFTFELGDRKALIDIMEKVEINYASIKSNLNYGDLSPYRFDKIASKTVELYKSVI